MSKIFNAGIKMMRKYSKKIEKAIYALLSVVILLSSTFIPIQATSANNNDEVILGGCLFGLKMQTKGIYVVGIDKVETSSGAVSPASDAGIKQKDLIISINGKGMGNANDVLRMISTSKGQGLSVIIQRGNETKTVTLSPVAGADGKYRAGIWIRDSAAGIGTVTYINPTTNEFAGLGHGICDSDTACLLPLSRGIVTEVDLKEVVKGQHGAPGEIKGAFRGTKIGSLVKNTSNGVYGIYSTLPSGVGEKIKTAEYNEIKDGKATIRCSVSGEIKEYCVEIKRLNKDEKCKNLSIKVTDKSLIELTGGIVQGMSGSPIIQNGKLIGAVTHVTVNNPTEGYGIFIGNMINNA